MVRYIYLGVNISIVEATLGAYLKYQWALCLGPIISIVEARHGAYCLGSIYLWSNLGLICLSLTQWGLCLGPMVRHIYLGSIYLGSKPGTGPMIRALYICGQS